MLKFEFLLLQDLKNLDVFNVPGTACPSLNHSILLLLLLLEGGDGGALTPPKANAAV
jgi:hypothetical protein